MTDPRALIIAVAVCAVAGLHLKLWREERPLGVPRSPGEVLHELVTTSDRGSRALAAGVLLALAFAALAPAVPALGSVLGTVLPF